MAVSEYEVENLFLQQMQELGYEYVQLNNYFDVLDNFKMQLEKLNREKIIEAKHGEEHLSETEFSRLLTKLDGNTVYESAKILRDKYVLQLDDGGSVYLDFFTDNTNRNKYQIAHQITMDPAHKNDVSYKNRYDVTVFINGLPLVQIELKRPGIEINEAINQINRYRKFSFRGLFRYLQIFVVSNSVQTKYFANANENDALGNYNPILKSLVFFWTDDKNERINNLQDFTSDFFRRTALTVMIDKYMVVRDTEPVIMVMRPYQIYAVQAAQKRVLEANRDGYVFACTGSGKTLTSFKLAQLFREVNRIDKIIFLIDRKDLDDQTIDEYNAFEQGCVDRTDSTVTLVKHLRDDSIKLMVTTIQKLSNACKSERYNDLIESYRNRKVVFIIDECHRSQFGIMHAAIKKRFQNANYIGFTGTPIFKENMGNNKYTTADIFNAGKNVDACLHRYMIKDAIADGNVLRFSVEYLRSVNVLSVADPSIDPTMLDDPDYCRAHNIDINSAYHRQERISNITKDVFDHYKQHTHPEGKDIYTAMFAVDEIKTLGRYYDEFMKLNEKAPADKKLRIAAIFTYGANEDMDPGGDEHSQELLERCMKDYNKMFGTAYDLSTFDAYRKDISRRLKQKSLPQIDLLLVVNMFLTGFDAKPLNTLYLDKNLVWHTLLQAYSRTNRVDKLTKQFGQIVTYRNIKKAQDDALRLFSGDGDPNQYLLQSYEFYTHEWFRLSDELTAQLPTAASAGHIQSEDEIRKFIITFRQLSQVLATLKTFSKFDWKDLELALSEDEYLEYKSWYLYYYDLMKKGRKSGTIEIPADIDFDIELIRTDKINVVYILNLLKEINRSNSDEMRRSVDLILREIERSDNENLRYKTEIMKQFVNTRFFELQPDEDIKAAYEEFERESLMAEIEEFAHRTKLDTNLLTDMFGRYAYSQDLTDNDVRSALEPYHLKLLVLTKTIKSIMSFISDMFVKYRSEEE